MGLLRKMMMDEGKTNMLHVLFHFKSQSLMGLMRENITFGSETTKSQNPHQRVIFRKNPMYISDYGSREYVRMAKWICRVRCDAEYHTNKYFCVSIQ